MASSNAPTSKSAKQYSKHATEKKTNGPAPRTQYFGPNALQSVGAWDVHPILPLLELILYSPSISLKLTIFYQLQTHPSPPQLSLIHI